MDLGPKLEPSFDAAKPEAANEAASPAAPQDSAASAPAGPDAGSPSSQENAAAKAPPIPSSALVILPPSKQRFDGKDAAADAGRPRKRSWLRAASQTALLLILCGASFAAGGRYLGSIPLLAHIAHPAPAFWQAAKTDDTHTAIAALGAELQQVDSHIASLRAAESPDDVRALKKSVDGLKASFATASSSIAQLSAKLDQIAQSEPKLTRTSLEKTERNESTDPRAIRSTLERAAREGKNGPVTTASLPPGAEPQSAATQLPASQAAAEPRKPLVLSNWVVRDVYDGIALVEGPQGALEVMPGDTIPGAGTVKAIERRGAGWIVLTSRGLVNYAGD